MVTNRPNLSAAVLVMTLVMTGCGGSDSDQPVSSGPSNQPKDLKLEVLTGTPSVNLSNCQSVNGAAGQARFSRLLRATVYKDAVYLAETGEDCTNLTYFVPGFIPKEVRPAIRKLSGGMVETAVDLNGYFTAMSHPIMVRYPSGFQRRESTGESFVLGYAAAVSDRGFALDEREVARYTDQGGWNYYVPGLFRFTQPYATYDNPVAGMPGRPPALVDGVGQTARFVAPHDLETDAAGVFYVIDDGRIRTIDASFQVKTLDTVALGITGTVKALDSDRQGNIHVLAQRGGGSYTWHRLADGARVDFQTRSFVITEVQSLETFTVVGSDLVLSVRSTSGDPSSRLYRVSTTGAVKELTGTALPATPQDFLNEPSRYLLPPVQHLEFGVDGHLYIVLPQGVLIARNYT